jgi:hypothetical protein
MAVGSQPTLSEVVWCTLGITQHGPEPFAVDLEAVHFIYGIWEYWYEIWSKSGIPFLRLWACLSLYWIGPPCPGFPEPHVIQYGEQGFP